MECKLKTTSDEMFERLREKMTERVQYIISNHSRCNTLRELFVIAEGVHRTHAMVMWDLYFSAPASFRDSFSNIVVEQYFMKQTDIEEALLVIANELIDVEIESAYVPEPVEVEDEPERKAKSLRNRVLLLCSTVIASVFAYLALFGKI